MFLVVVCSPLFKILRYATTGPACGMQIYVLTDQRPVADPEGNVGDASPHRPISTMFLMIKIFP